MNNDEIITTHCRHIQNGVLISHNEYYETIKKSELQILRERIANNKGINHNELFFIFKEKVK